MKQMRFVTGEDKTRLNLIYRGTETRDRIENIQRLGQHGTVTEAIARSLRLYEVLLEEQKKGNHFEIVTREGVRSRVIV